MDWEKLAQAETAADVTTYNKRLADYHGKSNDGRPTFRVVWSRDELEKRIFEEENGKLFGTNEIKKYWYLPPCWVFERLVFHEDPNIAQDQKGLYEPVHAFYEQETGRPLPLSWKVIEYLTSILLGPTPPKKNAKQIKDEEKEDLTKQQKEAYEILDNDMPYMGSMLGMREATTVPDLAGTGKDTKKMPGVKDN